MKHVFCRCFQSWKQIHVKATTIQKCWNKLFDGVNIGNEVGDDEQEENLHDRLEYILGCEEMNYSEINDDQCIVDMVLPQIQGDNKEDDVDDLRESSCRITADESFNGFEVRFFKFCSCIPFTVLAELAIYHKYSTVHFFLIDNITIYYSAVSKDAKRRIKKNT